MAAALPPSPRRGELSSELRLGAWPLPRFTGTASSCGSSPLWGDKAGSVWAPVSPVLAFSVAGLRLIQQLTIDAATAQAALGLTVKDSDRALVQDIWQEGPASIRFLAERHRSAEVEVCFQPLKSRVAD